MRARVSEHNRVLGGKALLKCAGGALLIWDDRLYIFQKAYLITSVPFECLISLYPYLLILFTKQSFSKKFLNTQLIPFECFL